MLGLAFPGVPGVQHFGHTGDGRVGHHQRDRAPRRGVPRAAAPTTALAARSARTAWEPVAGTPRRSRCAAARTVDVDVRRDRRAARSVARRAERAVPGPGRRPTSGSPACCRCCGADGARRGATRCAAGSTPSTASSRPTPTGTVLSVDAGLVVTARRGPTACCRTTRGPTAARPGPWHALAEPAPVLGVRGRRQRAARRPRSGTSAARTWHRTGRDGSAHLLGAGAGSAPATWPTIHGDTLLGSADELLDWVRRADAAVTARRRAARPAARVGPAHGRRQHGRRGVRRVARREVARAAHGPPGARAAARAARPRGPARPVARRAPPGWPTSLPRLLAARRGIDGAARRARGAGAGGAPRDLGPGATGHRLPARPDRCPGDAVPVRRRRAAVRRHRLRPLHRDRARRERPVVARLGRAVGVGPRRPRRSRWGVPFGASGTRRARTRPTSWPRGRRRGPSRSSPTGSC